LNVIFAAVVAAENKNVEPRSDCYPTRELAMNLNSKRYRSFCLDREWSTMIEQFSQRSARR
jgi:hypothetical protein